MKKVKIETKTFDGIMTVTNDFLLANILPLYKVVKIHTSQISNGWKSIIEYKERDK